MVEETGKTRRSFQSISRDIAPLRVFGFFCNRAWIYIVFFNPLFVQLPLSEDFPLMHPYIVSISCLAITMIFCALAQNTLINFLDRKASLILCNISMIIGAILWAFLSLFGPLHVILLWVCGVMTGFGSALLLLQWGCVFGSSPSSISSTESALSYLFAAVAYLVVCFLPAPVNVLIILILPLLSTGSLIKLEANNGKTQKTPATEPSIFLHNSFLFKLMCGTLCIGVIVATANELNAASDPGLSAIHLILQFFLASVSAPLIMLAINFFSRRHHFGFGYRPVLVFMVFGVITIPFFALVSQTSNWIMLIGFHCFDLMLWSLLADLSYRFHVSPILAFGLGRGALYLANAFGSCLGVFVQLNYLNSSDFIALTAASTIITLFLVVTFSFVLTEQDLISFHGVEKDGKPGLVMQSCNRLAEEYGLSPREEAVIRLLVKGRSIIRIQEELYMSKGTVNTHLHHIYRKLGIHNKQEILDLVENDSHRLANRQQ